MNAQVGVNLKSYRGARTFHFAPRHGKPILNPPNQHFPRISLINPDTESLSV
jgi:hypothetical protein